MQHQCKSVDTAWCACKTGQPALPVQAGCHTIQTCLLLAACCRLSTHLTTTPEQTAHHCWALCVQGQQHSPGCAAGAALPAQQQCGAPGRQGGHHPTLSDPSLLAREVTPMHGRLLGVKLVSASEILLQQDLMPPWLEQAPCKESSVPILPNSAALSWPFI